MATCKECGSEVWWHKVGSPRKIQCFNPDGTIHWDKCSQLRFERIRRTGEHFQHKSAEGYKTAFKKSGVQLTMESAGFVGPKIDEKGCKRCVPPWEHCPNNCPIEFKEVA